jgi:hypothetical protein
MIISLTYHSIYHSSGPTQTLMIDDIRPQYESLFWLALKSSAI